MLCVCVYYIRVMNGCKELTSHTIIFGPVRCRTAKVKKRSRKKGVAHSLPTRHGKNPFCEGFEFNFLIIKNVCLCVCLSVRYRFLGDGWADLDETLYAYCVIYTHRGSV